MKTPSECIAPDALRQDLLQDSKIIIVDVRSKEEYEGKHIPGAINIPSDTIESVCKTFDPNTKYITVCGKGGGRSADAAEKMKAAGFKSIWLCGGTFGWFEES